MNPVYIFITMGDGEVHRVMEFQRGPMRSPTLPFGATWDPEHPQYWIREATETNIFAEIEKACPPVGQGGIPLPSVVSYKVIAKSDLPTSREFRDAWEYDGTTVVHNMDKAKQIYLTRIRDARASKLGQPDRDWMQAVGDNDTQQAAAIEQARQTLRDISTTLSLDNVTTIDELKAMWPVELPRS